jgi:hypothetical protein
MFAPLPFALHATAGCPPHAELALSLACSFVDVDAAALDAEFDAIARLLPAPPSDHPLAELKTLACLAGRCVRPPDEVDTEGVLLHTALASEAPHPLALAIIGAELARRRGMTIGIVSNGHDHCLAHTELAVPLLLLVETGQVLDANALEPTLTWRCAHETAGLLLDELEPRFLAQGRLDKALHAAELRLCLPFNDSGKRVAERKRQRVRARLN